MPGPKPSCSVSPAVRWAPGTKDETNSVTEEIEFEVNNVSPEAVNQIGVFGTGADETFTMGEFLVPGEFITAPVINMNAGVEGTGDKDTDVIIRGFPGEMFLAGQGGTDVLRADGTGTILSHASTADVLFLDGDGADTIVGGSGDDQLSATGAPDAGDSFVGGAGFDTLDMHFRTGNSSITLNGAADDGNACPGAGCEGDNIAPDVEGIITGTGSDHLVGAAGHQELNAGDGLNVLVGGGGNDLLIGGSNSDQFHGGKGFDLVSYFFSFNGVHVTIDGDDDDGVLGEHDNVAVDVEGLYGSSTDDFLIGNAKRNKLFGGAGDDELRGLGGNDLLNGGGTPFGPVPGGADGSDELFGGPGTDTVTEAEHDGAMSLSIDGVGNDIVNGAASQGIDNIRTDVENVIGGPGGDHITGSPANNKLTGGGGNDTIAGQLGNDTLLPGAGVDTVNGGQGTDTVSFADSAAAVTANLTLGSASGDGDDKLVALERASGSPLDDTLRGSAGPNVLTGLGGDDSLFGLAGKDRLVGGEGDDDMNGGADTDTCLQGPGSGSKTACEH